MTGGMSRRDILKTAAASAAMAAAPAAIRAEDAQNGLPMNAKAAIDATLRQAVESGDVPGVVAMATSDKGLLYQGAFGVRNLAEGTKMTEDTVFRIASMTKAVTSVAALQLVEAGKLSLEGPVPDIDPALSKPQVLEGFDASGAPILRAPKQPITLRHLLTHTAGFSYEQWDANTQRYVKTSGMPSTSTGKVAALRMPLAFDPGAKWEYGINIDWVGRIVEEVSGQKLDAYCAERILGPLGMRDTGFVISPEQRARQTNYHQRQPDGKLEPQPLETPFVPEFWAGGGGLYSTAGDYTRFVRLFLNEGSIDGVRVLKPETVALAAKNQIGDIEAGILKTTAPARSTDVDFFPGQSLRWGLATMINVQQGPNGRSPGTLTWAGIFNTHYWIDPQKRIAGVIMMQTLPFGDPKSMRVYGAFEKAVYGALA